MHSIKLTIQGAIALLQEIREDLKKLNDSIAASKKILSMDEFVAYSGFRKATAYRLTSQKKLSTISQQVG